MGERLIAARPTAVNLAYAVHKMMEVLDSETVDNGKEPPEDPSASGVSHHVSRFLSKALEIRSAELENCRRIGEHGLRLIQEIADRKGGEPVNILTHCNAGWLATVDYGTALAPVYLAHDRGIPVHVWVDETRPRNQGAKLTVFELTGHGIPNTLIVDNAGGLLMQQGKVDLVITGADRITANGDAVNKIGTYLKALAAFDNRVPFYVAAPTSTFDQDTPTGQDVVIEERSGDEVLFIDGHPDPLAPPGTRVHNPGFDVTPFRLVTAFLTEEGVMNNKAARK
jgi:methylthioribose-1-phosphate isomerase